MSESFPFSQSETKSWCSADGKTKIRISPEHGFITVTRSGMTCYLFLKTEFRIVCFLHDIDLPAYRLIAIDTDVTLVELDLTKEDAVPIAKLLGIEIEYIE